MINDIEECATQNFVQKERFKNATPITSGIIDDYDIEECSLEDLVKHGMLEDLIRKLKTTPVVLDDENYHDYLLVITALRKRRTKVAKYLINNGFRVYKKYKNCDEKTPLHYAIYFGQFDLINTMLLNGAKHDILAIDNKGKTPLQLAIKRQDMQILSTLLLNLEKEILDNMCLLHYAVKNGDVRLLKLIINSGASLIKKNTFNETPFCIAVKEHQLECINLLWEAYHSTLDTIDHSVLTGMLILAILVDDINVFMEMLDVNQAFRINTVIKPHSDGWALFEYFSGFTLFHIAVKYSRLEIVNYLLQNLADSRIQDNTGSTPLHIALEVKEATSDTDNECYNLNEKIIDSILCAIQGVYDNPVNKYGISHFHLACTQNTAKLINNYLENGASLSDSVHLNSPVYKGFAPLHFAAKYMCKKTAKILLERGANIDQEAYGKVSPIHLASKESSLEVIKLFIKYGANITKQDCKGNTPVHYAFEAKNYKILDFLLSVNGIINSNPVNPIGISHFHIACTRNDLNLVSNFLRNGASVKDCVPIDPNIQYVNHNDDTDWRGCSPLHFAAAFNRTEIVQFLLEQNASIGISDTRGFTPFHMACQYSYEKFSTLMDDVLNAESIFKEIDKNYKLCTDSFINIADMEKEVKAYQYQYLNMYEDEESILIDWSTNRKDHINMIKLFMQNNSDVNQLNDFGHGPLLYICYFNLNKIWYAMNKTAKCNILARVLMLKSLLNELCHRRQILVDCIFKHEVNMERCYNNGSILHYMAVDRECLDSKRLQIMKILLDKGANVNAIDDRMRTPLHLATLMKDKDSIDILLEYNANVNCIEASMKRTPLHIATSNFDAESLSIIYPILAKNADVNMKQGDGRTPVHNLLVGRYHSYLTIKPLLFCLVSLGADVNIPDNQGKTPLFVAIEAINREVVEDLLMVGADVTAVDGDGVNIYYFIYKQIKAVTSTYDDTLTASLYNMFWLLLKHALKLHALGSFSADEIVEMWYDLKAWLPPAHKDRYPDEELDNLSSKCYQEVVIFKNTVILKNTSIYDFIFLKDHQIIDYIKNSSLKDILELNSFDEIYHCYGYLIKLQFTRGLERSRLLPTAEQYLACFTNPSLPTCLCHSILQHLNNAELRLFSRAMTLIEIENTTNNLPVEILNASSKYIRLA